MIEYNININFLNLNVNLHYLQVGLVLVTSGLAYIVTSPTTALVLRKLASPSPWVRIITTNILNVDH